jgi:leader peptidase (prepilin peptidase)/N-methyltransferase
VLLEAPEWLMHGASFVFGLVFGSFTNVLVARLPHGQSISKPASRCPHCGAPVLKRHNIPLLGYAMLGGRCRSCRAPISIRYPIIELLGGILFLAAQMKYGWSPALFIRDWPFLTMLLAITFIDLEHRIIPDKLSLGGLALGLATGWLSQDLSWIQCALGAALGFGLFYGMAWGYSVLAGRQGLGGGDIKLLAMMGAFLGPAGVFTTIVISSITGSVVGIGLGLAIKYGNKRKQGGAAEGADADAAQEPDDLMSLAIPYGPFLVIGGLSYYFFKDAIWLRFTIPT